MLRRLLPWLLIAITTLAPATAAAQGSPDMVVRLTALSGERMGGVQVLVHDRSGQQVLAEGTTDASGEAVFERVPLDTVRVAVRGTAPGGADLTQRGSDAGGALVFVDVGENVVDLVVEANGLVQLNPATSVALENGTPQDAEIPDATLAPTVELAISPAAPAPVREPTLPTDNPLMADPPGNGQGTLIGWALIALIAAGIAGVLITDRRAG